MMMTRRRLLSCGLLAGVVSIAYGAESTGQQGKGIDRKDVASASARGGLAGEMPSLPQRKQRYSAHIHLDICTSRGDRRRLEPCYRLVQTNRGHPRLPPRTLVVVE